MKIGRRRENDSLEFVLFCDIERVGEDNSGGGAKATANGKAVRLEFTYYVSEMARRPPGL